MQAELSGIVLDCADAQCLAQFYEALLGWPREDAAPGWHFNEVVRNVLLQKIKSIDFEWTLVYNIFVCF